MVAALVGTLALAGVAEAHTLSPSDAKQAMQRAVKPLGQGDAMVGYVALDCRRRSRHRITCVAEGAFHRQGDPAEVFYYCGGRYVATLRPGHPPRARTASSGPRVRCREVGLLFIPLGNDTAPAPPG